VRVCILTRGDLFPTHHGAAVKIVRTAESLARATGEPVAVVTDDRAAWWRFDGTSVEQVPYTPRVRAAEEWPVVTGAGRLAERLVTQLGYPAEETFLYRPLFDPAWWLRAAAVGRAHRADVFQAEFPGYGVPAALASRLGAMVRAVRGAEGRPRSVIVQHNVEWDRLAEFGHTAPGIRRAELAALSSVDDIIAVSLDDRRRMVAAGVPADRVTVIPHGVDVARFRTASPVGIRQCYGIAPSAPLLFFHGTLHYWPNTEAVRFIVEKLLPRLTSRFEGLRALVVGMNPPRYYSHPAVVFTGAVDNLAEHIAAADLCVCPLDAGGGTRMKILEYMAAGKAVVSTSKGAEGIRYTPDDNIFIADGPEAFAQAVTDLLQDPTRRAQLGAAAAGFGRRFDWSAIARAYVELFEGPGRGRDYTGGLDVLQQERSPLIPVASDEARIAAHLPSPRSASKPRTMLLLVNRGCNLRCSFCDLWDRPDRVSRDKLRPILEDAVFIGTKVLVITGGEPLMHKELFGIVADARALGLTVNITTNGTLVERRWQELVDSKVDSLSFSLDGLSTTHDRIRGKAGAFKETLAALDRALAHGIPCSVYFTATAENVHELLAVWSLVRARGARFDFWPVNDAPDQAMVTSDARNHWLEAVRTISAVDSEVAQRADYLEAGVSYHAEGSLPMRCLGLVDQFGVKYTGEFIPCCVWEGDGLVLGNVFEHPLRELWTAPATQRFRESMFHEGCDVGCYNHSLYEFGRSTALPFQVVAANVVSTGVVSQGTSLDGEPTAKADRPISGFS